MGRRAKGEGRGAKGEGREEETENGRDGEWLQKEIEVNLIFELKKVNIIIESSDGKIYHYKFYNR